MTLPPPPPPLLSEPTFVPEPTLERLPFHRQFRGAPRYRGWKPLVFAILATVFGFTLTVFITIGVVAPVALTGDLEAIAEFEQSLLTLDTQEPIALFVALASLAVWIPAIIFAAWAMGLKPLGRLWSVERRIRWGLLFRMVLPALLALVVMNAISIAWGVATSDGTETEMPVIDIDPTLALISLAIIIVLVPLQATAEELMFRGALMQILGAWIKNPIIPVVLPTLLFALAHIYDVWGLLHVALLGLTAAWLTWRTGGLEAAIVIHVMNNYIVFFILVSGVTGVTEQQTETGADAFSLLGLGIALALYAWIAVRIFERGPWKRYSLELTGGKR